MLDAGCWMLDAGCWMLENKNLKLKIGNSQVKTSKRCKEQRVTINRIYVNSKSL
jgi:hypothetical protein